jgi:hypothetical protein
MSALDLAPANFEHLRRLGTLDHYERGASTKPDARHASFGDRETGEPRRELFFVRTNPIAIYRAGRDFLGAGRAISVLYDRSLSQTERSLQTSLLKPPARSSGEKVQANGGGTRTAAPTCFRIQDRSAKGAY